METDEVLSADVLGRFSVMQSMVTMLPNEISMLEFVCQGMQDIGGVKKVTYRLFTKQNTNQIKVTPPGTPIQVLIIKHRDMDFGALYFELSNPDTFQLYLPFISNFVTMLGVIFDQQKQHRLNENLMKDLEHRVKERTRELQEKETDLRITLNSIGDAVISTDLHGCIMRMNPVAEHLTGWKEREAKGRSLTDVFTIYNPENLTQVLNPIEKVLLTGQTSNIGSDTILITRNRTHFRIADSIAPIQEDDTISGVVLVFRDVTESFRTTEALKQKTEELDNFFELTPNLLSIIKKEGSIVRANKAWTRILGYSVDELYKLQLLSIVHSHDQKSTLDAIVLLQSKADVVFVNRCRHKDSSYRWIEWHWTLVGDKIFSAARDITEQKQNEELLWLTKERFRLLFEMSPAGAAELESETGHYVMVNQGMCNLVGYTREEMLQTAFQDITYLDDLPSYWSNIKRMLRGEINQFSMEKRIIRKDGRIIWVILTVAPLWRPNEYPKFHIAIVQDITEYKQVEFELKSSLHEKELLLLELYHRTKNNMQVILSILAMQELTVEDEKTIGILKDAQNRIRTMGLVHQKLYESKNLTRINMSEYLKELVRMVQSSSHVPESQVKFRIEAEEVDMPIDLAVPCGLVLNELLTNSLKYAFPNHQPGRVDLQLHYLEPSLLELIVADNGVGPPRDFDPRQSSGIGMQLIYGIVEKQLKGSISLQIEHGMRWEIRFPTNLYKERV